MNGNYSIGRTGVLSFVSAGIKGIMRLSRKTSMLFVLPSAGAKPAALFSPPETPQGLRGQSQKYAYLRPARQMNNHYPAVSKVKAARRGRKSSPVSGSSRRPGCARAQKGAALCGRFPAARPSRRLGRGRRILRLPKSRPPFVPSLRPSLRDGRLFCAPAFILISFIVSKHTLASGKYVPIFSGRQALASFKRRVKIRSA